MKSYVKAMPSFVDNEEIEALIQKRNDLRGKVHGWGTGIQDFEMERARLLEELEAREQALRTNTIVQTMTRNLLDTPEILENIKRIEEMYRRERESIERHKAIIKFNLIFIAPSPF